MSIQAYCSSGCRSVKGYRARCDEFTLARTVTVTRAPQVLDASSPARLCGLNLSIHSTSVFHPAARRTTQPLVGGDLRFPNDALPQLQLVLYERTQFGRG
jgi:hypothetical protein